MSNVSNIERVESLIGELDKAGIWTNVRKVLGVWRVIGGESGRYTIDAWPDKVFLYTSGTFITTLKPSDINYIDKLSMFITEPGNFITYLHNMLVEDVLDKLD